MEFIINGVVTQKVCMQKMIMNNDVKNFVEGYKNYTGCDLKVQNTPGGPVTTLSKSDLEEPYTINKYRSFVGQLM